MATEEQKSRYARWYDKPWEEYADRSFPQWTMQGIKHDVFEGEKEGGGDLDYYRTPDGDIFWNQEDAQEHVLQNFWDPAEIDLPQIIKDLEGTNVKDFGAIPSYLLDSDADLMDSSTWDIGDPYSPDYTTKYETMDYVSPADANKSTITNMNESELMDYLNRVDPKGDNMSIFGKENADLWDKTGPLPYQRTVPVHENVNILDYYASQGNPELRRGSSTGFFPTKYYPEAGIWGLRKNLEEGKLFEKYTDPKSLAHYKPWLDLIGFDYEDVQDRRGNINRRKLNRSAGHEGIHMAMMPDQRGREAIEYDLPYPENIMKRWSGATGHPAMLYSDNLFFPGFRSNVDVNKEGWENLKAIMNWTPDTNRVGQGFLNQMRGPTAPISRARDYTAGQKKQSPKDYTAPDRGDWGPGLHLNTGGIVSLML